MSAALTPTALAAQAQSAAQTMWDYIVIGAGTAGLPAAIFASRRGATLGPAFVPGMMLTPALSLGRMLGMTLPIGA